MRLNLGRSVVRTVTLGCVLSPMAVFAADAKPSAPVKPVSATAKPEAPKLSPAETAKAAALKKEAAKQITVAIAALTKEYQAYAKDPLNVKLRDKANYFVDNKAEGLTDEQLLGTLNTPVINDPAAEGYIKWQLSSGLSAHIDDSLVKPLYFAYVGAPAPLHRPGMAAAEKAELDKLVKGVKNAGADVMTKIDDALKAPVDSWQQKIIPTLAYRDALQAKMTPGTVFAFSAHLDDIHARVAAGITMEPEMEKWRLEVKTWVGTSPPTDQTTILAKQVLKIIDEMGGIPKQPKAAGDNNEPTLASVIPADSDLAADDTSAPVILAAAKPAYTPPKGYGNMNTTPDPMKKQFPPKYYDVVEFDTKTNMLKWQDVAPKFITIDILVTLYQELRDSKGAAPMDMKATK